MDSPDPQPNVPATAKPKRRPRYRGTHPRHFHEKYKELQAERYAGDVARITAHGKTPAGTHRPILVDRILDVLQPGPGMIVIDATLGYGGHARELLRRILPGGRLYGIDVDPIELPRTEARLRAMGIPGDGLMIRRMNFAGLPQLMADERLPGADIILADLGVSSMQIDNPARGFTYKREGPLDLRLNPGRGKPAAELLNSFSEDRLARILEENADEPNARVIAAAIITGHRRSAVRTTTGLAGLIRATLGSALGIRGGDAVETCIRRVFQALRIEVNDEFSALDTFLRNLPACLNPRGRTAILTFHSGEDRRVKKAFQAGARDGAYSEVSAEVIRPDAEEIRANPRSSSAKLRWAIRAEGKSVGTAMPDPQESTSV